MVKFKFRHFIFCLILFCLCVGAEYTPIKFTLTDVSSAHGSDANAGCPSACINSITKVCDCVGVTHDTTGITPIDGVIPMLDLTQTNWAVQLYTATTTRNNLKIEFQFPQNFMLRQLDLYLFFCPPRNIPNEGVLSINVYQSIFFPNAIEGLLLGNTTLSVEGQNCADIIQISILTNPSSSYLLYLITFSMGNVLGGIYIGEVIFFDQVTTSSVSGKSGVYNK